MLVTTTNELSGHRIVQHLGLVRGITVRSRNVFGAIGDSLQSLFGGNISLYTGLAERAREEAYELMIEHAQELGANAVLAMRYDANDIAAGITRGSGLRNGGRGAAGAVTNPRNTGFRACIAPPPSAIEGARRAPGPFWPPLSLPEECSSIG